MIQTERTSTTDLAHELRALRAAVLAAWRGDPAPPDHAPDEALLDEVLRAIEARRRGVSLDRACHAARVGTWSLDLDRSLLRRDATTSRKLSLGDAPAEEPLSVFLERLHPDDRDRLARAIEATRRDGSLLDLDVRVPGAEGQTPWLRLRGGRASGDGAASIAGVALEVTERRRALEARELELERERRAVEELRSRDRQKDELLSMVSHELRSPLGAVLGWSQLARRDEADEGTAKVALEVIERQARAQLRIVEDLLDYGRIAAGKLELRSWTIDLAEVAATAVAAILPRASKVSIDVLHDRGESLLVAGDAERLQQVLGNVLDNAVKFTPIGGTILVAVGRIGDEAEVRVRDTGRGIAPEQIGHVFERFWQSGERPLRVKEGLGLGLPLVARIVELHGGRVWAESAGEGCGTTVVIRLPLARRP